MQNIILLNFSNKDNFPPGKWLNEPDFCSWFHNGFPCLVSRDMNVGTWNGFVGVDSEHSLFGKNINALFDDPEVAVILFGGAVYGGIVSAGLVPNELKDLDQKYWWFGISTAHINDFLPLGKTNTTKSSYKDFKFIRKEANKLTNLLLKLK